VSKPRWYEIAEGEIGVTEDPDENIDNPRIVEYFTATDFMNKGDDEIPWCSAFANWCMVQAGIEGTHSARARSWDEEGWGEELDDPREGCLVVFERPPNPANGHVGFFAGEQDESRIRILGGNQGPEGRGAVSISNQSRDLALSYRWPSPEMLAAVDRPGAEKPARVEVKIRRPEFTAGLVKEYELLFAACTIQDARLPAVDAIVNKLSSQKSRYENVGNPLGIPWCLVAVIHNMECSCNFNCHLHNGDPLSDYTVHVPAGRPAAGSPPFSWEASATDALTYKKFNVWTDWSLAGILYKLEIYNGWGYRKKGVASPYLWSFSNHYTKGKYVEDGVFDPEAVSKQAGAAAILKQMLAKGVITLADLGLKPDASGFSTPPQPPPGQLRYSGDLKSQWGEDLQVFLNLVEWIDLEEDGYPGDDTSMAFRQVTGYFLPGDEREGYRLISYAPDADPWELVEEFQKLLNSCGPKQIEVTGVPGQETSDAFKELTGYYLYGDPRNKV
jgi:uncharacterized protein (TIGR02594 family)